MLIGFAMKKTSSTKRLLLSIERIRDLQSNDLQRVAGGVYAAGGDSGSGGDVGCGDCTNCTDSGNGVPPPDTGTISKTCQLSRGQ